MESSIAAHVRIGMTLPRLGLAFLALVTGLGCLNVPTEVSDSANQRGEGKGVLFIGNSYLYVGEIPNMVRALADSAGGEKLAVAMVAGPDFALIDHWIEGTAPRAVDLGGWSWVVLQQGPSSTDLNRDTLRLGTKLFADRIAFVNARTVLFSAWPAENRQEDFPRAIDSYHLAADDVGGIFLPVANAWLAAWKRDANLKLYSDGLHPSDLGSYLSALVTYGVLLEKSPVGLPSKLKLVSGKNVSIDPAVAALLQAAAAEAIAGK